MVSAVLSVLLVSAVTFILVMAWNLIAIASDNDVSELNSRLGLSDQDFFEGVGFAAMLSGFNFFVSPIVIPVTLVVLSQTTGRLPHRGISRLKAYMTTTAVTGGLLVGLTCTIATMSILSDQAGSHPADTFMAALGGFTGGLVIGLIAGVGVGAIHYMIVRPKAQLENRDHSIADQF